jgi:hypothetical protein
MEIVSRKKTEDYQIITLNPGNKGSKHHRQYAGPPVWPSINSATSLANSIADSSFRPTLFIARVSTCRTQQVWGKDQCKGFIVD